MEIAPFRSSEFNIKFLDAVLQKYCNQSLISYVTSYKLYRDKTPYMWKNLGIPNGILHIIQKEVQMACLIGKCKLSDMKHLNDLWNDYIENNSKLD